VYATTESAFKEALKEAGEEKKACKEYLEGIPAQHWAAYAYLINQYSHITFNMVKAMNAK
jgi:hypothetical protein